jgi:hypothetical protein
MSLLRSPRLSASTLTLVLCLVTVGCGGLSSSSNGSKSGGNNTPPSTASVSGAVTPAADGSGVTVTLSGAANATATADSSGNYTFTGLANGSYTVRPAKAGFSFSPSSQAVTINGANVSGVNFAGVAGCSGGGGDADFYVGTNGSDSWSGTLECPNAANSDGPLASIAQAQIAVRKLIQTHPNRTLTVMVRQGTYYLPLSPTSPGMLNFTASDSGTSQMPVIWENYPGEMPVVSGGEAIEGWTNSSGNLWQVELPPNTQPFEYLFYNGGRRLRSRLQSNSGVGYYMNDSACYSTATGQTVALTNCNLGTFLRVAAEVPPGNTGCPSVSDGTQSKCLDRFKYNPSDPVTTWANLNGVYTGDPSHPCSADNSNSYPVGDIELMLFDSWTVDVMRVNCVDTSNHIVYFTGPTRGLTNQYVNFGPTAGHRYIVENTYDAFQREQQANQTGLWFLDRSKSPWTLFYLANSGENPNQDNTVIPQLQPASATTGSMLNAVQLQYVSFRGIVFEMDDFIPPAGGFNDDETGGNTLPAAIDCESCQYVTFDGITVRHTSTSGLQIASLASHSGPPAANDVIQNSAFYDVGSNGLHIGHMPQGYDLATSVVQSVTVQNNIIQGYGRVFPDGEGIAEGNGNNILYQHNDINDGYHAGISICVDGCPGENGNGIVSQYNHLWNLIQGITSDGGSLYYATGDPEKSGTGNKILNNLIHDVSDSSIIDRGILGTGYGGHGIYLDFESAGVSIENNVVYRVSADTAFMSEGPASGQPPNIFQNNIFAYGRKGMFNEGTAWPQNCNSSTKANLTSNILYFDQNDSTGFYAIDGCADSCGMAFNQYQNFQRNLYWRTDGQFATYPKAFHVLTTPPPPDQANSCSQPSTPSTAWTFFDFPTWQSGRPLVDGSPLPMNEDAEGTVSVDPGFGATGLPTDFLLSKSPVAGFDYSQTNDTINTAGRTNPVIQPPTVPATFPTYYYTTF